MVYCPVWWRYKNMIYAQRIIRLDTDQRDSSINTGSWLQCPHHPRYCKYWDIGLLISPAIPSILIVSPAVALFPTADVKWLSCDLQTCRPYHLPHYGGIFRLSMVTNWLDKLFKIHWWLRIFWGLCVLISFSSATINSSKAAAAFLLSSGFLCLPQIFLKTSHKYL